MEKQRVLNMWLSRVVYIKLWNNWIALILPKLRYTITNYNICANQFQYVVTMRRKLVTIELSVIKSLFYSACINNINDNIIPKIKITNNTYRRNVSTKRVLCSKGNGFQKVWDNSCFSIRSCVLKVLKTTLHIANYKRPLLFSTTKLWLLKLF